MSIIELCGKKSIRLDEQDRHPDANESIDDACKFKNTIQGRQLHKNSTSRENKGESISLTEISVMFDRD